MITPMLTPDWSALSLSIQRCVASYIPDHAAAVAQFESLGSTVLGRYVTDTNQALLHYGPNGDLILTDAGTRFSEGPLIERICDVAQDWNCDLFDIGGSRKVAEAPFQQAADVYNWAYDIQSTKPLHVEGHSLGGWKATYASEYIDRSRIASVTPWESPHQGNEAYWTDLVPSGLMHRYLQIYNGEDPWGLWPWEDSTLIKGPAPLIWIQGGKWSWAKEADLPKADFLDAYHLSDAGDHGPESIATLVAVFAA